MRLSGVNSSVSLPPVSASRVARPAETTASEALSASPRLEALDELQQALQRLPQVRPEALERGRRLLAEGVSSRLPEVARRIAEALEAR